MRFKDQQGNFYALTEGEWVYDGVRMVRVSRQLSSLLLTKGQVEIHPNLYPVNGACTVANQPDAMLLPVQYVVDVEYVDDEVDGTLIPTVPGPTQECCEAVAEGGQATCATKIEVEVK